MAKAKQTNWNQVAVSPVILVFGAEDFLASRAVRAIKQSLLAKNPALEISELDAGEYEAGRLIELTEPSLFNEPRLVIIDGLERCTDEMIEDGIAYLKDVGVESTVVFKHAGAVRGKKLLDSLRENEHVTEILCNKLAKEQERVDFAAEEFRAAGRRINNLALRKLVSAFGDDSAGLASACLQLMQDVVGDIDEAVIDQYFGGRVEVDVFKVIDAAVAGNAGRALELLRHVYEAGQDPVQIVGAIAHKMRLLAKVLNNRGVTAAQLGTKPFFLDNARRDALNWTEEGMANVITEVARADAASKGAERDAEFAVERLLILIANRGKLG